MKRGCGCLASAQLIVVGLILSAVGGGLLINGINKKADFVETSGVIVDLVPSTDSDGDTTYAPIVEFLGPGDEAYRFQSEFSRSPAPDVGDTVGVLYNPSDPTDATEDSAWLLWVFPGLALFFGIPVTIAGIFLVRRSLRRPKGVDVGTRRVIVPGRQADESHVPADSVPTFDSSGRATSAQFRRVEPRGPDSDGNFEYRVVARDEHGIRHFSDWMSSDPTTAMLAAGVTQIDLEWRDGSSRVVGFPTDEA